ncbi:ARM repeat superfamily protein [Hirschfeldia incana]|nr:ARM repeat superfamily protein [Hirschfeldia incana]
MEKRLRSSLKTSAEEFLSSAVKSTLKSSKPSLKTIINSVKPSSDLSSSLPLALLHSILHHTQSFQNPPPHPPSPSNSPPPKRQRGNAPPGSDSDYPDQQQILTSLQVLSHVLHLCILSPKKAFSATDLLPAAQALHNNLRLFESDPSLCLEIAGVCESWWKEELPERETLISQLLPFLLSRSLTLKKKVDVHRVYMLREAFSLFDFDDEETIEDLRMLLMRCVVSPLYLKTEDGQRFLSFAFRLSRQLMKSGLAVVKAQIPFGRKSVLEGFGGILFRAWREVEDDLKGEIEDGFMQGIVDSAIHASSSALAASLRKVLGGFISQRTTHGVEKLLFGLAEPMIFRSLQVANSNVRLNALHLLLDLFPMEDPDATKEEKDKLLDKQFYLLEKLMSDECPDVRSVAVEGLCRVFYLFWEVIPSPTITKIITKIFNDMSHESCSEVRLSTVNGITYLLANPQSHGILKVLLPRLGHLMVDSVTSVRVAMVDLLLLLRDVRTFQFNTVVSLDVLLSVLASDQAHVAKGIARLLMPSYFPSRKRAEEACTRCRTLINRNPLAGARFCEFLVSLGATVQSAKQLVGFFLDSILSGDDTLEENQVEGLLLAAYSLCKDLVAADSACMASLKELLPGEKLKGLLAFAPTAQAQSAVFDILAMVSPDTVSDVLEDCMNLVVNCGGLPGDEGRQVEMRSVHKLLLSSNAFSDLIGTFTSILQKTAYRCQINFGDEVERKNVYSATRKKSKSSSAAKWKHVSEKNAISFEEDYSVAVGIAWQIKDLLIIEDARKAILESSDVEELCIALKAVSQTSILQASCCQYMDMYPVLAYTSLALHMTLRNLDTDAQMNIAEDVLDQAMGHILGCTEQLFQAGDDGTLDAIAPKAHPSKKQKRRNSSDASEGLRSKERGALNKVKMLTAILKFVVESTEMGLASHFQARMLKFTSAYLKYAISSFDHHSTGKLQFEDADLKDMILCTKCSTSYAGKLINLLMREASCPLFEAFDLANDLLDLFTMVEISLGSAYASKLVTALNPWIPDLVLALGPCFINNNNLEEQEEEDSYTSRFNHIKLCFPTWLVTCAKLELQEMDDTSESSHLQLPALKRLRNTIVSLVKGNSKVVDGIGYVLLMCSAVCIEKKDYSTVLGLLRFLCVKLLSREGEEDREWKELDTMLVSLPRIYPILEREIGEERDEEEVKKLEAARELLLPVWTYHVYETGRFRMMEEEE